jgi:hypothetical protein
MPHTQDKHFVWTRFCFLFTAGEAKRERSHFFVSKQNASTVCLSSNTVTTNTFCENALVNCMV